MYIEELTINTKGRWKKPVSTDEFEIVEGLGIENDLSSGDNNKQIIMMFSDLKDWMEEQEVQGICFSRFRENIRIKKEESEAGYKPKVDDVLKIGDVELKITGVGKGCFSQCGREQKKIGCRLKSECFFARVLNGGRVKKGDKVYQI